MEITLYADKIYSSDSIMLWGFILFFKSFKLIILHWGIAD